VARRGALSAGLPIRVLAHGDSLPHAFTGEGFFYNAAVGQ